MLTNKKLQAHVRSGRLHVYSDGSFSRLPAEAIECVDGFTVSVQASKTHYCSPRNYEGPYITFELGFPSSSDDLILEYAEDIDQPTNTVYGQVPAKVVLDLIKKHGGVAKKK